MSLCDELEAYRPFNEQEERDKRLVLGYLQAANAQGDAAVERLYGRDDPAHVTASAWIVSPDRRQVLMAYHNIYQSWSWLGGHADGERDLSAVALREVHEESGLSQVRLVMPEILSVEVLCVNGHQKRGQYVSSHLHLNLTYLVEADPAQPVRIKPDENSKIGWLAKGEVSERVSEAWMRDWIYPKLIAKSS